MEKFVKCLTKAFAIDNIKVWNRPQNFFTKGLCCEHARKSKMV